jgi:hypothetical protein
MAIVQVIERRTDDPQKEEEWDDAWRHYRYHGFHRSSDGTHCQPGHHPVDDKTPAAITEAKVVSAGNKKRIEVPTID